jgi:glycosyltransferase involved in cell wall biosynthesis
VLPRSLRLELGRRSFPQVDAASLHLYPWFEAGRLFASRLGLSSLVRRGDGPLCVDAVYRAMDAKVAARLHKATDIRAIYAYEDGALNTFRAAQQMGIRRIYELPTGYWRAARELLEAEAGLQPEWAMTIRRNFDSEEKCRYKDEELALADHVVVASQFVRRTLLQAKSFEAGHSVIAYGAPSPALPLLRTRPDRTSRKLRVIFVGSLSQQKGLSYLLHAVEQFGSSVELTIIGSKVSNTCPVLNCALQTHRWIPSLPHPKVLEEMSQHDVLVFPSLFDGFGLVLLEAMSQGLPVITTPNTAGPDFLTDGEDGFIVPIRSAEMISEKLDLLLCDRDRLIAMSEAARQKAALHSWENYRSRLVSTVDQALGIYATV